MNTSFTMEPDLQVILGSSPREERIMVHSQVWALQSDYVRGKLTNFNHCEPMNIRFPDVDRLTWDCAIKFLQPENSMEMDMDDVAQVLPFYVQYSFGHGIALCDNYIARYLTEAIKEMGENYGYDMDEAAADAARSAVEYACVLPKSQEFIKPFSVFYLLLNKGWLYQEGRFLDETASTAFSFLFQQVFDFEKDEKLLRIAAARVKYARTTQKTYRNFDDVTIAMSKSITKSEVNEIFHSQSFGVDYVAFIDRHLHPSRHVGFPDLPAHPSTDVIERHAKKALAQGDSDKKKRQPTGVNE